MEAHFTKEQTTKINKAVQLLSSAYWLLDEVYDEIEDKYMPMSTNIFRPLLDAVGLAKFNISEVEDQTASLTAEFVSKTIKS